MKLLRNPVQYFKVSVYFVTIDIIIQQIHDKFNQNSVSVMKDIINKKNERKN